MKFRKRPIVAEAEQWYPGLDVDGVVDGGTTDNGDRSYVVQTRASSTCANPTYLPLPTSPRRDLVRAPARVGRSGRQRRACPP